MLCHVQDLMMMTVMSSKPPTQSLPELTERMARDDDDVEIKTTEVAMPFLGRVVVEVESWS